jgi:hypothetical protein
MSAEHQSQLVVGSPTGLLSANARAIARQMGRGCTISESASGTIGVVAPWPHSVDTNGQTYPSGLLGVSWDQSALFTAAGFNATCIAVPDTLPGGFIPRTVRDIANGYGQDSSRGQFAPFSLGSFTGAYCSGWNSDGTSPNQAPRIRNSTNMESYAIFPENLADNAFNYNSTVADGPVPKLSGLRYIRTKLTGSLDPVYYDKLRVQVVRYSTAGAMTPDPTTGLFSVDATLWSSGDILPGASLNYDTGYLFDVTDLDFKAPAGTRCFFQSFFTLHTAATNPADPPNQWENPPGGFISAVQHWWGPRLDIPFPFTVFGEGANVAPGGVVSGLLTGY